MSTSSTNKSASATTKKPTTKRKGASKVQEDSSTSQETIAFVSRDEMKSEIRSINDELPDEILDQLTDNLYRSVEIVLEFRFYFLFFSSAKSRQYLEMFMKRVKESFAVRDSTTGGEATRKNEMKTVQETIKQLHGNICIFARSIESFPNESQTNLGQLTTSHRST